VNRNITIATFASHGLYKQEAYEANLWAGKILSDHGVPLAYKSVSDCFICAVFYSFVQYRTNNLNRIIPRRI
jgi:ribosomal protein S26